MYDGGVWGRLPARRSLKAFPHTPRTVLSFERVSKLTVNNLHKRHPAVRSTTANSQFNRLLLKGQNCGPIDAQVWHQSGSAIRLPFAGASELITWTLRSPRLIPREAGPKENIGPNFGMPGIPVKNKAENSGHYGSFHFAFELFRS